VWWVAGLGALALSGLALLWAGPKRRRRRLAAAPFPDAWEAVLRSNAPLCGLLPADLGRKLRGDIHIFLAEKHFEGCGGLEITDEVRVTIAALACLLIVNRESGYYPRCSSILVYPTSFQVREEWAEDSLYAEAEEVRDGESWDTGAVILAWDQVKRESRSLRDGRNVALHEFAHQLDQEQGDADGCPLLQRRSEYAEWARVLGSAFERLQDKVDSGRRSVLDEYAATEPAEFFAVATEVFFEKPSRLKKEAPELYEELRRYYRLDPAQWR